jgi:thiamine-phosphate pyrophosphorylase
VDLSGSSFEPGADFAARFAADRRPPPQLYLISPPTIDETFEARLAAVLQAGAPVAAFQLRLKPLDIPEAQHQAAALAPALQRLCAAHDAAFLVNDSIALAKRIGADGVHLGQSDGTVAEARAALGREAQIGVTCHASRHLAFEAAEAGADYVAFGAFYDTPTKPSEHRPDPAILAWWTTVSPIPCVAIGGITPENCKPLLAADFLAVSSAIWSAPDPAEAARAFARALG